MKTAAEVDDESAANTKKFAAAVMEGTKGYSPALECKRLHLNLKEQVERSPIGKITSEKTAELFRECIIGSEGGLNN